MYICIKVNRMWTGFVLVQQQSLFGCSGADMETADRNITMTVYFLWQMVNDKIFEVCNV